MNNTVGHLLYNIILRIYTEKNVDIDIGLTNTISFFLFNIFNCLRNLKYFSVCFQFQNVKLKIKNCLLNILK